MAEVGSGVLVSEVTRTARPRAPECGLWSSDFPRVVSGINPVSSRACRGICALRGVPRFLDCARNDSVFRFIAAELSDTTLVTKGNGLKMGENPVLFQGIPDSLLPAGFALILGIAPG